MSEVLLHFIKQCHQEEWLRATALCTCTVITPTVSLCFIQRRPQVGIGRYYHVAIEFFKVHKRLTEGDTFSALPDFGNIRSTIVIGNLNLSLSVLGDCDRLITNIRRYDIAQSSPGTARTAVK